MRDVLVDADQRLLVGMRHQQNRLGDVLHSVHGQARLIGIDQRDVVLAGNVSMIGGDEASREVDPSTDNLPAWNRGTNRRSIQHARETQIVDVFRGAGNLCVTVLPANIGADWPLRTLRARRTPVDLSPSHQPLGWPSLRWSDPAR